MVLESDRKATISRGDLNTETRDGGGSSSAGSYIFEHDLQNLSDSIGMEIRKAQCPHYCSRYNTIERRFFSRIARAYCGMLFGRIDRVVHLMRKASTRTGLKLL